MSNQILSDLKQFSSCDVSDAMITLLQPKGLRAFFLPNTRQLTSVMGHSDQVIGQAYTIKLVEKASISDMKSSSSKKHYLDEIRDNKDSLPSHTIPCISSPEHLGCASWGGILTLAANNLSDSVLKQKATLLVNGGLCRDKSEIEECGWRVYGKGFSCVGGRGLTTLLETRKPIGVRVPYNISMESNEKYSEVIIQHGDWIVADCNGVAIVPEHMLEKVVETCKKLTKQDHEIMEALQKGAGLKDSLLKHRK